MNDDGLTNDKRLTNDKGLTNDEGLMNDDGLTNDEGLTNDKGLTNDEGLTLETSALSTLSTQLIMLNYIIAFLTFRWASFSSGCENHYAVHWKPTSTTGMT